MQAINLHKRTLGVTLAPNEPATARVWAPEAMEVVIQYDETQTTLQAEEGGYWAAPVPGLTAGGRYKFRLDGKEFPDPASLAQPEGVHGPSQVTDVTHFPWTDGSWKNPALGSYILYELHTGTFTAEGTFAAIAAQLDHLVALGVNAIEIMPVAQFPGSRNWGYDGVFPYAVQDSYGGAEGLQRLVDACHARGIAVVLDVVYNHMGPEGNYLGAYGPYFTDKYQTPWGAALNFDDAWSDAVRRFFIENALMWFRDFHIDALRLDAVHAIKDLGAVHFLRELRGHVDGLMAETGRTHYLIIECDLNDTRFIDPVEARGFGMDSQWIDEFHHALRVTATGEQSAYYSDFSGIAHLAKAYRDAYVYDGQWSEHRKKYFGIPAPANPGEQFIVFTQNHDQVGNRMLGERTSSLVSVEMQKLMAGAVLLSPFLPMLWMGEEWGETAPFQYFVSHTDAELAEAVRQGRKKEFAAFHAEGEAPDPVSEETFNRSKLQWALRNQEPHATMLRFYQTLIGLRKSLPALRTPDRSTVQAEADEEHKLLTLHRQGGGQTAIAFLNFSKESNAAQLPVAEGPWVLRLDSASTDWGGPGGNAVTKGLSGDTVNIQPESFLLYTYDHV
ncbi:malto-oligosyltrehalose trehalohydrolase [Flaviaesturariibacter amylovorans]|uniref:Malto-oligosyltrehalose trehalohydrolase n=1 Tax=Flaviaesturariibacter amylovorans TaxID=1084520 RepID=A0ABP8GUD5_9BACT